MSNQGTSVEDTLKDFWATRPRRPRRGRKIAGVAAGIGIRYGIDPIIVRVAFVIATFYGGAGVMLYLLGWLLLPEQDDEAAPLESMINHKRSSTSSAFTVLLCLALIPAFLFFIDNEFSGILGVLLVAGTLYLLHRSRGHLGRPATPAPTMPFAAPGDPAAGTPVTEPGTAGPQTPATPVGAAGAADSPPRPPAWDPLGAAPFAWDLPEPAAPAPEPPAPRRRSKIGVFTFGLALVTAGTLALVAPTVSWLTPGHIVGIVLAILGLGMVGGAFVRGGRGLIGLAIPLSLIGLAMTVVIPNGWHGAGETNARPLTVADVQDHYQWSTGAMTLDLTALPDSGSVDTRVTMSAGEVTVIVPATADVDIHCTAHAGGDIDCLGREESGLKPDLRVEEDGPGSLHVSLTAETNVGRVEVRRG
ncbi:MAG TPA: PspC domain-containing protein [Actinophytocola sp.]|uniref:PspC domain-containing protein n=1 Tax=Actinophytocola sp. TaxID=1872138 RepID=UPI002DB89888|nr:PspC domain-containing protein [Actinophytocola sp.]HEU5471569.1 PspC domain-containing protein [Actinophytocola sp.]